MHPEIKQFLNSLKLKKSNKCQNPDTKNQLSLWDLRRPGRSKTTKKSKECQISDTHK